MTKELTQAAPGVAAEIIQKLRGASNWLRQGFGGYKDATSTYDRTPFEAADLLESIYADAKPRGWLWSDGRDTGVLLVAQDYEAMRVKYPRMRFEPFYSTPSPAPQWTSFKDKMPPQDGALDNPDTKVTRHVLVTNNLTARDRMGRMSHVWFAMPLKSTDGSIVAFDNDDRKIHGLTHWLDPMPSIAKPRGSIANLHVGDGRHSGPITASCDNVLAWRMGEACKAASKASAGDLIDRGLALLRELNEQGLDVSPITNSEAQP